MYSYFSKALKPLGRAIGLKKKVDINNTFIFAS